MLDWKGDIVKRKDKNQILLKDVIGSIQHENKMEISPIERKAIEVIFNSVEDEKRESNIFPDIPQQSDEVGSIMNNVNPILNDQTFLQRLIERAEIGTFCMNIDATNVNKSPYLSVSRNIEINSTFHAMEVEESTTKDEQLMNELFENIQNNEIDIDSIMSFKSVAEDKPSEEKQWVRTDPHASAFLTTLKHGPAWRNVTRRVTISLANNSVLEDIMITPENNNMSLHRKLPDGVVGTKTILYYNVMAAHADRS